MGDKDWYFWVLCGIPAALMLDTEAGEHWPRASRGGKMAPKDVSAMISAEINGMDGYDAAVALSEMSYTGWLHESAVWLGLGRVGWRWDVRSDYWYQGRVVKTVHARMPEGGEPVWCRDVAAAQCAVAISAILESRGGYAVQESNEYRR